MQIADRDLRTLPKAHLHLHLVGSMRPSTLIEKSGTDIEVPTKFEGFDDFELTFQAANNVIREPSDLNRLIREVLEDAKADGAVWIEPTLYLDSFKATIGPGELVLEIVTDAIRREREQVGIGAKLIVPAQRNLGPQDAVRQAHLALRGEPDVIGAFGLVNDETTHRFDTFAEALGIASRGGLPLVPHAGEFGTSEEVAAALKFGVARIQHGIAAARDARITASLVDRNVCLDVCPTSNVALGAVESLQNHPLPSLLGLGVPISLGADDPLLFSCSLLSEYQMAREAFGLNDQELALIAEASIRHSTASDELVTRNVTKIGEWLLRKSETDHP